jgi:hypothetical protein
VAASLERVRGVVDTILEEAPPTLLELKRRLAGELAIEPKAEVLQALSALAEMSDPKARAVTTRAAVLHLVLESAFSELWERPEADPAALDRALAALPALLDLARAEGSEVAAAVDAVDRTQRDAVGRIHGALRRPEDPLIAALSVVPELNRLVLASRAGRLEDDAPYLHAEEVRILAASSQADTATLPERALVDSVALRSAIERSLAEAAAPAALAELRAAHTVVSLRLDALRARRFEKTRRGDPLLDAARRRLFTTYLALSKALAGEAVEPTPDVRESILAAEREGAAIDAEKAHAADAIKSAADGAAEAPREAVLAPDARDLASERRRKKVLTSIVAALVPIAVGVNLWLLPRGSSGTLVELKPLNVAMPVSEAVPIAGVLYSQIATFLWDGMDDAERTRRLTDLGRIAGRQGYRSVVVVDDTRTERAYWTVTGGVKLRAPDSRERETPTRP